MAFTAADLKRVSEKLGIPMLPEDHPYYSEGAQITFVSRKNKVSTKPGSGQQKEADCETSVSQSHKKIPKQKNGSVAKSAGKRQASEDFIAHVAKFAQIIEKDTALQARLRMEYDYVDEFGAAIRLLRSDNIVLFVQEAKRRGLEFTKQEAMAYYDEAYQQNLREGR